MKLSSCSKWYSLPTSISPVSACVFYVNLSKAWTTILNTDTAVFRLSLVTHVCPRCLFLKLRLPTSHSLLFPFLSSSTIYIYSQHWNRRKKCSYDYFQFIFFFFFFDWVYLNIQRKLNVSKVPPQISPTQPIDKRIRQCCLSFTSVKERTQNLSKLG